MPLLESLKISFLQKIVDKGKGIPENTVWLKIGSSRIQFWVGIFKTNTERYGGMAF